MQLRQLAAPLPEYVPAMHDVQLLDELAPSIDEDEPELQLMQLADELAPLYVPAPHYVQLAAAAWLYEPAWHDEHEDAPALEN